MREYILRFWYLHIITLAVLAVTGYVWYWALEDSLLVAAIAMGWFVWTAGVPVRYYRRWVA